MKLGRIALWALIIFLLSGVVFGAGLVNQLKDNNWTFNGLSFFPGPSQQLDVTEEASIDQITKIVVMSNSPNIQLTAAESNQVTARLHGSLHLINEGGMPQLVLTQTEQTLTIEVKPKSDGSYGFISGNLKLEMTIPVAYHETLSVTSASGSIHINQIALDALTVHSSSGSIDLINISSENDLLVTSSSGSISSKHIEVGNLLNIKSTSGSIHADVANNAKEMQIVSTSGSIKLVLADSDNIDLKASTTSGSIQCSISLDGEKNRSNSISGKRGNGDSHIKLTATSGSIIIQ